MPTRMRFASLAAHRERHDERDDADHPGELHQCAEATDHTGRRRVIALREHDRAEERDTHQDVVAATVDEVERGERAEREERDRIGRSGAAPHDDADGDQRRRREPLVEEPGAEERRAQHDRRQARQRGERGAVHRRRVSPRVPHQPEQRVVRVLRGDVRVRTRVVHREDAAVDRVPPEVFGCARRAPQRDDRLQRDRRADELDRQSRRRSSEDQGQVRDAGHRDQHDVRAVRQRRAAGDDDRGRERRDDERADRSGGRSARRRNEGRGNGEDGGPRSGGQSSSARAHRSTDRSGGSLRLRSVHDLIVVGCR